MWGYVAWTLGVILASAVVVVGIAVATGLSYDGKTAQALLVVVALVVYLSLGIGWLVWYVDGDGHLPESGVVTDRQFNDPPKGSASWSLRITDPTDLNEDWVQVSSDVFNDCQFGDVWPECSVGRR